METKLSLCECECECECPCAILATCLGCSMPFAQCQWDWLQLPSNPQRINDMNNGWMDRWIYRLIYWKVFVLFKLLNETSVWAPWFSHGDIWKKFPLTPWTVLLVCLFCKTWQSCLLLRLGQHWGVGSDFTGTPQNTTACILLIMQVSVCVCV